MRHKKYCDHPDTPVEREKCRIKNVPGYAEERKALKDEYQRKRRAAMKEAKK